MWPKQSEQDQNKEPMRSGGNGCCRLPDYNNDSFSKSRLLSLGIVN